MSKLEYKINDYFLNLLISAGFTRRQSQKIFNSLVFYISDSLLANNTAKIEGFGDFKLELTTQESSTSRQDKTVKFYPASAFEMLLKQFATQSTQFTPPTHEPTQPTVEDASSTASKVASTESPIVNDYLSEEEDYPTLSDFEDVSSFESINQELTDEQRKVEYDTHYNVGIAYKEMMLYEMAIDELKIAVKLIENHLVNREETLKFIQCCGVISLCYSGLANYDEAEKWLLKGIELTQEREIEYKALRYDLAQLYETTDRLEQATEAYFDVYALDITFRRVAQKIKTLQTRYIKKGRDERVDQLIPVIIRGRNTLGERFEEETLIVNVSRRGAGLRTTKQLQPDTFLEIHFENPSRVKIAKVVWCKSITSPVSGFQVGVLVYHEPPKEHVTE